MPIGVIFRALTCLLVLSGAVLAQGLTPPPLSSSLQPPSGDAAIDSASPEAILVVGGTRRTGLEIVRLLRSRGHTVSVMARHTSDITALEAMGIPVLRADALSEQEVRQVIMPGRYKAIISTLGAAGREPKPDFEGNRNLIDAAKAAGIKRFLLVTVIGAGDSAESPPWIARWFLQDVIALKSRAEDYLKASGLEYTIIRPGGLLDKDPSHRAVLTEDPETFSWIARADLGQLVADALEDRKTIGHTYSAFDPTRDRIWNTWKD